MFPFISLSTKISALRKARSLREPNMVCRGCNICPKSLHHSWRIRLSRYTKWLDLFCWITRSSSSCNINCWFPLIVVSIHSTFLCILLVEVLDYGPFSMDSKLRFNHWYQNCILVWLNHHQIFPKYSNRFCW